jgi:colanic acid/amylovoran biosynthesis protein
MASFVILPACDDTNRGDQALVWQTRAVANEAGYTGDCYMLSEPTADTSQSQAIGITPVAPILRHPSARYRPASNLRYNPLLLLIWGAIALFDFLSSVFLLTRAGRVCCRRLGSDSTRQTLAVLEGASACFVKGGGFLHSTKSVADPYRAYYFLFHVLLAQSMGKPVYVMPNSYGPFEGKLYRYIVRLALRRCAIVTARESISRDALHSALGISAELYPDLAFSLAAQSPSGDVLAEVRHRAGRRPIVGITARPYRFPGSADPLAAYQQYLTEFAKFAEWLHGQGYFPLFVEHVSSPRQHESDISAINEIVARLDGGTYEVISRPDLDARGLKSLYGACDFVVGTRFHSVIFALSEGTRALAVGYGGNKSFGIMKDLGLSHLVLDIAQFTADSARRRFERLESDTAVSDSVRDLPGKVSAMHAELVARIERLRLQAGE